MSAFTLVFYHIPEDFDDPKVPNAFAVQKAIDDITLTDIENYFPLPGDFIFRFKYKYNNATVWMDLTNKKCRVPKVDDKIIIKVTRKIPKYTVSSQTESKQQEEAPKATDFLQSNLFEI